MSPSPRPPADSNERRQAILDIAAQSFAKHGFHGVSMRDIAKLNKSSVATIYNHFDGKDALLLAIAERYFGEYMDLLRAAAQSPGTALDQLLRIVELIHSYASAHYDEFASLFHDARHVEHTDTLAPVLEWRRECVNIIIEVVDAGIADGSIRTDVEPPAVVSIVSYCSTGLLDRWRTAAFVDPFTPESMTTLLTLLRDGLRPPASGVGTQPDGHPAA